MNEEQQREFQRLLTTDPYREGRTVAITSFDKGEIQGITKGKRQVIIHLLEKRFGPLANLARQRVDSGSEERLDELLDALLDARSLKELGLED